MRVEEIVCAATVSCVALSERANGTYTPEHTEESRPCKPKSTSADVKSAGLLHPTSFADSNVQALPASGGIQKCSWKYLVSFEGQAAVGRLMRVLVSGIFAIHGESLSTRLVNIAYNQLI